MEKNDIRKKLKKLRIERNLNQNQLSKATGLSRGTISRIENLEKDVTVIELVKLLNYYKIPISTFFNKIIYLESDRKNITKNFNKIATHYQKHKDSDLNLIKNEIHFFRMLFEELEKDNLVNLGFNAQYYMELPLMYPKYFNKPNIKLLNINMLTILNSTYWFDDDFLFIAVAIPYLPKETIELFTNNLNKLDYLNFSDITLKYYELIFENLSDYYLVNYKKFDLETLPKTIDTIFQLWNEFAPTYSSMHNQLILQHNHAMYEFLFNKRDKEILKKECDERNKQLRNLGFSNLASHMQNESDDYYNGVYGNLNISLKY